MKPTRYLHDTYTNQTKNISKWLSLNICIGCQHDERYDFACSVVNGSKEILERIFCLDTYQQLLDRDVSLKFSREFFGLIKDKMCGVPVLILPDRGLNVCKQYVLCVQALCRYRVGFVQAKFQLNPFIHGCFRRFCVCMQAFQ